MTLLVCSKKPSRRKPLIKKIEKDVSKEDLVKKKEDSAYLSSFYFKDIVSR